MEFYKEGFDEITSDILQYPSEAYVNQKLQFFVMKFMKDKFVLSDLKLRAFLKHSLLNSCIYYAHAKIAVES